MKRRSFIGGLLASLVGLPLGAKATPVNVTPVVPPMDLHEVAMKDLERQVMVAVDRGYPNGDQTGWMCYELPGVMRANTRAIRKMVL